MLLSYALGVISGILLSLLAVLAGKNFETKINAPLITGKAQIIKRKDPIDEYAN